MLNFNPNFKKKIEKKIRRNLGPNFISLTMPSVCCMVATLDEVQDGSEC